MRDSDDTGRLDGLHDDLANCTDEELADHVEALVEEVEAAIEDVTAALRSDADLRPSDVSRLGEAAQRIDHRASHEMYQRCPEQPAEDVCPECGTAGGIRSSAFLGGWDGQCRYCGRPTDGESGASGSAGCRGP